MGSKTRAVVGGGVIVSVSLAIACADVSGLEPAAESTGSGASADASEAGSDAASLPDEADESTSSADASSGDTFAPASSSGDGLGEDESTGAPIPAFDDIPWVTGDEVGYGIAYKDSMDPSAQSVFIGYAGYPFPLDASQSWVTELWHARLAELGVRHVYAVQGPADVPYSQLEIGNSKIAEALPEQLGPDGFVLVAAHSSGSYVAHELFQQLAGGLDPEGVTFDRVVYFNLDGGLAGIDGAVLGHLRRAYFVSAFDGSTGTGAANLDAMAYAGDMWPGEGGYVEVDASGSGCAAGAPWCLHMAVINSLPHDPWASDVVDYFDFDGRPVVTEYIDAKAADAGLLP